MTDATVDLSQLVIFRGIPFYVIKSSMIWDVKFETEATFSSFHSTRRIEGQDSQLKIAVTFHHFV